MERTDIQISLVEVLCNFEERLQSEDEEGIDYTLCRGDTHHGMVQLKSLLWERRLH